MRRCDAVRMAATINVSVPELELPPINFAGSELDQLRREVAELRRELATLRDALAAEVRTRRIVVSDGELEVTVEPGRVDIEHPASGNYVIAYASAECAELHVTAGDKESAELDDVITRVSVHATLDQDYEPGGPKASMWIDNGDGPDELQVPPAASS